MHTPLKPEVKKLEERATSVVSTAPITSTQPASNRSQILGHRKDRCPVAFPATAVVIAPTSGTKPA